VRFITFTPARSAWRVLGKAWQFFGVVESSAGPDYARAKNDNLYLMINPLGWAVFLALGLAGMALGWRSPGVHLTLGLAVLALAGGLVWYPSLESRAPVAALLALLSGGLVAQSRPFTPRRKVSVFGAVAAAAVLAWLPRPNIPAVQMAARDCRERALASAALGDYDGAIRELAQANNAKSLLPSDRELITGWRFSILLKNLPASPAPSDLEQQLLDNADLAAQSPAAQFRSGVCLWLLGRYAGAIYFWDDLANSNSMWGAAARAALANSGRETPAQAQRRRAWEIGGGPRPDPALAPLFARLHADQPN
jgi:tetratricopeptide (TPR) repeat protein